MAITALNYGSAADDPTADTIRATFAKIDALYQTFVGLTPAANKFHYFTGATTGALADISAFALTILDDANGAAVRTTIGAYGSGDTIVHAVGSVSLPSVTFSGDLDSGLYWVSANKIGFAANGVQTGFWNEFGFVIGVGGLFMLAGTAANPAFTFVGDPDTGIYNSGANELAFATGGALKFYISSGNLVSNGGVIYTNAGTAAAPGFSIVGDSNTGIYGVAADQLGFSAGGTLRMQVVGGTRVEHYIPSTFSDGSAATPSAAFNNNTTRGFFNDTSLTGIGVTVAGSQVGVITAAGWIAINGTRLYAGDGTAALPSLTFGSDTDTGFLLGAANAIHVALGGAAYANFNTGNFNFGIGGLPVYLSAGAAATPSVAFAADTNTGLYSEAADSIGFTAGGTLRVRINTSGLDVISSFLFVPSGSVSQPGVGFRVDTDNGLYYIGTDNYGLSVGGVLTVDLSTTRVKFGLPIENKTYTVATLPAGVAAGRECFATDCRVFNGTGTQEGAAAGTGGLVTYNGTAWKIAGTNVTAVA